MRRLLATAGVVALGAAWAVVAAPGAGGQATASEQFSFTAAGAEQPFVVPPAVCAVTITASGAGGGGEGEGAVGGSGGRATATIAVAPGETLVVRRSEDVV